MAKTHLSRFSFIGASALAGLLAGAPAAIAAPLCVFDPGGATVTVTLDGARATLQATSTDILLDGAPCGGAGPDNTATVQVDGSAGDDLLVLKGDFRPAVLDIDLGAGDDTVNLSLGAVQDVLIFSAAGADLAGDGNDDLLLAGVEETIVRGMDGDDVIDASAFLGDHVVLNGGDGDDTLVSGAGADRLLGGAGDDILLAGAGNDMLNGGDGNDIEQGQDGDDVFNQGSVADGADTLRGGAGLDRVNYSTRTVALSITLDATNRADGEAGENDVIGTDVENAYAGSGDDFLSGSGRPNVLRGGAGNDTLLGKAGDDDLSGGDGDDRLDGNAGTNILRGQAGNDTLIGDLVGIDTFVAGDGDDHILNLADGIPESVSCGAGNDTYQAAVEDTFKTCEIATP